jgi:hypothetical protein
MQEAPREARAPAHRQGAAVRKVRPIVACSSERVIRLDERERVFAEIRTALSYVRGFRSAALVVEEWKKISDQFPENAVLLPETPREA